MISFTEYHGRRAGIVTNQPDGYDQDRAYCSVVVCDRPECQTRAKQYVAAYTNETAVFVPDERS